MEIIITAFLIVVALGLNIKATLLIAKDSLIETHQRFLQLLLVWLLPLLGALVVLGGHRAAEKSSGKYHDDAVSIENLDAYKHNKPISQEISDSDN
jgi:hypothetical protein